MKMGTSIYLLQLFMSVWNVYLEITLKDFASTFKIKMLGPLNWFKEEIKSCLGKFNE